jgi:hypothetical protein
VGEEERRSRPNVPPDPNAPTTYSIVDSGPSAIDQWLVVDTSYLELVRLGVKAANDPNIMQTLEVVDPKAIVGPFSTPPYEPQKRGLRVDTPSGTFWHRFNFDGYGETRDGGPWDIGYPACDTLPKPCLESQKTIGRVWHIFADERGEYELLAGGPVSQRLTSVPNAGNAGYMLPEQVWDDFPPSARVASRLVKAPSRPRRYLGRLLNSCAWPGPSKRGVRSSSRRWSPSATSKVGFQPAVSRRTRSHVAWVRGG